jgi:hypothetical protein
MLAMSWAVRRPDPSSTLLSLARSGYGILFRSTLVLYFDAWPSLLSIEVR